MHSPSHLFSFFFLSIASSFSPPQSLLALLLGGCLAAPPSEVASVFLPNAKGIHPMCPALYQLENHKGDPTHGNICRSIVKNDQNFVCPRCCTTVTGPPYCANKNSKTSPCRSTSLEACGNVQKAGPKIMHTFFETVPSWIKSEQEANIQLLRAWERSWNTAGWKTKVLTLADAQSHPDFAKFNRILDTVPLGTNIMYDKVCYIRHLAMAQAGGGWMADGDTIPLHIKPGMPPPNNGRWTSQEWSVPSLVSGNKSEWHRMAFMLANTATKHKDEHLFSDMMAMQELATKNRPHTPSNKMYWDFPKHSAPNCGGQIHANRQKINGLHTCRISPLSRPKKISWTERMLSSTRLTSGAANATALPSSQRIYLHKNANSLLMRGMRVFMGQTEVCRLVAQTV